MRTNLLKKAFLAVALATCCFFGVASANNSGTQYGKVALASNAVVQKGDLTFIAFINGSDDVIHTENAYNCALGLGNGYVVNNNEGYWLVNFANFADAEPGDTFEIQFTARQSNQRASIAGTVPPGLTQTSNTVALANAVAPLAPTNLRSSRTDSAVQVTWNAEPNTTYRVYRADLPSGAENGASRGIYNKVAQGVNGGSFTDANTDATKTYWYLVVAENKNGVLSGRSDEVRALPVNQLASQPEVSQPQKLAEPQSGGKVNSPKVKSN